MREEGALHLDLKQLGLDRVVILRNVRVGLPAGFPGVVFSLSNVVIQSSVNSFGDAVMAGSAASQNVEGFVYAAMNSFYQAAITFVGQNYGAGKCKRVDRVALYCVSFSALTGLIFGNLVYLIAPQLIGIYSPGEAAVLEAGLLRLGIIARFYAIAGIMDSMVGVLRGIGHSVVPMVVSVIGSCALRLVWVATVFQWYPTQEVLFASYPITWAITGFTHLFIFLLIRKKAYQLVAGQEEPYLSVEGCHPE
jgi:Na+-driven multidrug efflux pump